jgi:hypothetical protein
MAGASCMQPAAVTARGQAIGPHTKRVATRSKISHTLDEKSPQRLRKVRLPSAAFSEAMPPPGIAWLQDGSWFRDGLQSLESLKQNGSLLLNLEGLPQGMSEGVTQEEGPRRLHLERDLFL